MQRKSKSLSTNRENMKLDYKMSSETTQTGGHKRRRVV